MKWLSIDLSGQENKIREYPAVDIMKLICTVLVVVIHTNPLDSVNRYLNYALVQCIARLAVPFFFVASGYFCFRKTNLQNFEPRIPMAYAKRIFLLYIIWTSIYLPQIYNNACKHNTGVVRQILSCLKTIFLSGYHHLWYLIATTFAIIVITLFLHLNAKIEPVLLVGISLYIVGLLGQSYFGLLKSVCVTGGGIWKALKIYETFFETTRNGLFEGILFVSIGALLAYKRVNIRKKTAIIGLIISILFMPVEAFTVEYLSLARETDMYICLVPASFFLFYVTSQIAINSSDLTRISRKMSSLIYFTHSYIRYPVIGVIEENIKKFTGVADFSIHSLLRFCIVLTGAIMVSYIIIRLQEHNHFRWLKKIY